MPEIDNAKTKIVNNVGEEILLPYSLRLDNVVTEGDIPALETLYQDGRLQTGLDRFSGKSVTVNGTVYKDNSREDLKEFRDRLKGVLVRTPVRIYEQAQDDEFLIANVLNIDEEILEFGTELNLSLEFDILKPFYFSDLKVVEETLELNEDNGWFNSIQLEEGGIGGTYPTNCKITIQPTSGTVDSETDNFVMPDEFIVSATSTPYVINLFEVDEGLNPDFPLIFNYPENYISLNDFVDRDLDRLNDKYLTDGFFLFPKTPSISFRLEDGFSDTMFLELEVKVEYRTLKL